MTGLPQIAPSYSWSNSQSETVSSAEARSEGVSRSFAETAGRRIAEAAGSNESGVVGGVFSTHEAANRSQSFAAAKDWAGSLSNETGGSRASATRPGPASSMGWRRASRSRRWPKAGRAVQVRAERSVDGQGSQASDTSAAEFQRIASQMADHWRNDQSFQAQFGSALAYDMRQGHEDSVFANRSVQSDQGLQRQASEVLAANREYRNVQTASAELGDRVNLSEPDLVGMIMRDEAAREYVGREAMLMGLSGKVQEIESGIYNQYPTQAERQVAAELRALSRVGPVEKQMFLEDLGEKLMLTKARELGDAQEHAGIGADPASFGTVQGKVAGMDGLGAGIEAAAKGELAQRGQAVEAGRDQVMNRSAENNAAVQHHQDINRVEGQIGREATDQASEELGSDANLATPIEDVHKGIMNRAKKIQV